MPVGRRAKKTGAKAPAKAAVKKAELKTGSEEKIAKYFYAVGKRKTAVAQVRIYSAGKGHREVLVNGRAVTEYFPISRMQAAAVSPLAAASAVEKFDVKAKVKGGGINSQAEALRLGLSRALIKFDESLKKQLKDLKYLTRDSREVERKKPGLKKARKAPQWAKR